MASPHEVHSFVAARPTNSVLLPDQRHQFPAHYRLATVKEGKDNREAFEAMPGGKIANLADSSMDGRTHGDHTRTESGTNFGHQLAILGPNISHAPQPTFALFPTGDLEIPSYYRPATVEEAKHNREALFEAMPGWEIANLADGSVDGKLYGGHRRTERRTNAGYQLAILDPNYISQRAGPSFVLFPLILSHLPPHCRLATVREVSDNRDVLLEAMPGWEIANLADGSVDGLLYGGHVRKEKRYDVGHQLAIFNLKISN